MCNRFSRVDSTLVHINKFYIYGITYKKMGSWDLSRNLTYLQSSCTSCVADLFCIKLVVQGDRSVVQAIKNKY